MPILRTEAIVLRVMDYSETSLIVWLYSRDHGRLHLIAKGARRARSPFEGALEPLVRGEVVFYRKKRATDGLETAKEFDPIDLHTGIRRSLRRLYRGAYLVELLTELSEREAASPGAYEAACVGLRALARADEEELDAHLLPAELRLIDDAGLAPRFDACTCERRADLDGAGAVWFSASAGGLLCPDHARRDPSALQLPRAAVKSLAGLREGVSESAGSFDPQVVSALRELLDSFLTYHLGKRLKLAGLLRAPASSANTRRGSARARRHAGAEQGGARA